MENVEFLGEFSLRSQEDIGDMPVLNASCLWRAWRLSDGSFVVQPLDDSLAPWGTYYPLPEQDFQAMLRPYPDIPESGEAESQDAQIWHGENDILAMWYEEAASVGATPAAPANNTARQDNASARRLEGADSGPFPEPRPPAQGDLADYSTPQQFAATEDALAEGLFADPFFLEEELDVPAPFRPMDPWQERVPADAGSSFR